MKDETKNLELYMRQSEFMWRFQQTVALVEIGVFSGWYTLYSDNKFCLALALLGVGSVVLCILVIIIHRTSQYLNALRDQAMKALSNLEPPKLTVKSYKIAIAIPVLLILFNIVLGGWQLIGFSF